MIPDESAPPRWRSLLHSEWPVLMVKAMILTRSGRSAPLSRIRHLMDNLASCISIHSDLHVRLPKLVYILYVSSFHPHLHLHAETNETTTASQPTSFSAYERCSTTLMHHPPTHTHPPSIPPQSPGTPMHSLAVPIPVDSSTTSSHTTWMSLDSSKMKNSH